MIEPVFEGARARCMRHHERLLKPGEYECDTCKLINRNLSLKPPFPIRCDRTYYEVKKDAVYTVLWIIRDGARDYDDHMIGYVLKNEKGGPVGRVYDATDFTPLEFLPENEREKLNEDVKEDEKEEFWCG